MVYEGRFEGLSEFSYKILACSSLCWSVLGLSPVYPRALALARPAAARSAFSGFSPLPEIGRDWSRDLAEWSY